MGGLGSDLRPGRDPQLPALRLLAVEVGPRREAPGGPSVAGDGESVVTCFRLPHCLGKRAPG